MMRIRSPSIPRMIGLPTIGPQLEKETPGVFSSVSARLFPLWTSNSRPLRTENGMTNSSELTPKGLAVTGVTGKSICSSA